MYNEYADGHEHGGHWAGFHDETVGLFMNVSDGEGKAEQTSTNAKANQPGFRRPASWLSEVELKRRARRRNTVYWSIAVLCMLVFVTLIYLLLERTRWSAGSSSRAGIVGMASGGVHRAG